MNDIRRLLSNSTIVFAGTIVSGAFSYLFNVLSGRLLGPERYGQMSAILSLFTVVSVAGGAMLIVAMRYAGELYYAKRYRTLARMFSSLTRRSLLLAGALFLLGSLAVVPITRFFSINEALPVIIAFSSLFFSFALVVSKGVLQGTQRFGSVAVASSLEMIVRVAAIIVLVKAGFGLSGALWAVVLGSFFSYLITLPAISKLLRTPSESEEDAALPVAQRKEILSYAWQTLITSFFLTVLLSLDVLVVKRLFPDGVAGQYAALSAAAKIIFFLTSPIVSVMFPMISEKKTRGEKHYQTFLLSLVLTLLGALVILGIYMAAPRTIMFTLYKENYVEYASLLPQVGLYIVFYALVHIFTNYFIAIRDFVFLWLFAVAIIAQVALVEFYHQSLGEVVRILILTIGGLFVLMVLRYIQLKKQQLLLLLTRQYVP